MVLKKLFKKLKGEDQQYPNRFLRFYHKNKQRLNKERRSTYKDRKKKGICVRCNRKALQGIVFCKYHQKRQKEYNRRARNSI